MSRQSEDHQRVLSEASHDLANHIHRSFYFLELLADAAGAENASAQALLSRLRESIESIEVISRSTLQLVRPLELRPLRVRMEDLVKSLTRHAGLRPVELAGDLDAGRCEVDVDPARMSEALGLLCKAAAVDDGTAVPIVIELIGGDRVGIRIPRAADAPDASASSLDLALTSKIAELHGGALEIQDGDHPSLTLRLPLAVQGT